jgi:hypothetical protein
MVRVSLQSTDAEETDIEAGIEADMNTGPEPLSTLVNLPFSTRNIAMCDYGAGFF